MQEADPLVDFSMGVELSFCGSQDTYRIDLAGHVMKQLRAVQSDLATTVHTWASHYHWSETEIFAVAPWRRDVISWH